jgi:hypothetical protein
VEHLAGDSIPNGYGINVNFLIDDVWYSCQIHLAEMLDALAATSHTFWGNNLLTLLNNNTLVQQELGQTTTCQTHPPKALRCILYHTFVLPEMQ